MSGVFLCNVVPSLVGLTPKAHGPLLLEISSLFLLAHAPDGTGLAGRSVLLMLRPLLGGRLTHSDSMLSVINDNACSHVKMDPCGCPH